MNKPTRSLLYSMLVLSAVAITFCFTLRTSHVAASQQGSIKDAPASVAPAATFPANSATLGAIPDGTSLTLPAYGAPRDVTFTVSGQSGTVSAASVSFTSSGPSHTFRGDLEVTLKGPGGSPSHLLFSRTGATSNTSFGSGSDLSGPYNFTDTATGSHWWAVTATPTTPGDYRTVGPGFSATNPPVTSLNTTFAGTAPNGTWTLTFRDGSSVDTGSVSAASLTLTTSAPPPAGQHVVDLDGDGKTDFVVVRNTGGGPTGQITWFGQQNGGASQTYVPWGIATDFFVPEDYDGDGKTDIAIWRPGPPFSAVWAILQSQTSTARIETFGQTGDDPTVVGDYDGDNKADMAVYRGGAASGDPSFWYWRQAANGPVFNRQWGQNGDFLNPGDFDNDGKNDFSIQRNNGGGQAAFYTNLSSAAAGVLSRVSVFGTPTDVVVPGDYDGDGKTDIATVRGSGGNIFWFYEPSTALNTIVTTTWGLSASDFLVQGDYDGDGKTDQAVWRPNADPTLNFFYARKSSDGGLVAIDWGQNGDYPVANFNSH
jgi:hypothetical protein